MNKSAPIEILLTTSLKEDLKAYVSLHPECVTDIAALAVSDTPTVAWRAAWLLWACIEKNDSRVAPYVPDMIRILLHVDDNRKRELLKVLQLMDIHESDEVSLFDTCMTIWEKPGRQPSVRLNALRILLRLAAYHPEFKNEMAFIAQEHYLHDLPDASRRIARRLLRSASIE